MAEPIVVRLSSLGSAGESAQKPMRPTRAGVPEPGAPVRVKLSEIGREPSEFDLGEFLAEMGRDTIEGAVAPVSAAWNAGRAILADPTIGVLPASEQEEFAQEAGRQAIKGAAFWGSTLVGGRILGMAAKPLWRAVAAGGAGTGTFQTINLLPEFMSDEGMSPNEYFGSIATAATFGGLTGGVISRVPQGSRWAVRQANRVIDAIPGGARVRTEIGSRISQAYTHASMKFFTSGQEVLKRVGLENVAKQLLLARSTGLFVGGRHVAGFYRNVEGLKQNELELMGSILDRVNFRQPVEEWYRRGLKAEFAPDMPIKRFNDIFGRAEVESRRLWLVGKMIQRLGVKTYDPDNDTFHSFVLRNSYLPHRIVNADLFRSGGIHRAEAIRKAATKYQLTEADATAWVDTFADRLAVANGEFASLPPGAVGQSFTAHAGHYLQGRNLDLPGFETNVRNVLPQYYEHTARRMANHALFGPTDASENAVRTAQLGMFDRQDWNALVRAAPSGAEQLAIEEFKNVAGQGVKRSLVSPPGPTGTDAVQALKTEAQKSLARTNAIMSRYPRAFEQLGQVQDPELRALSEKIIRRQLGAIENTPYGEGTLRKLAVLEVVTKLALGAIAQPSQMLSAIARTGFRSSIKNMFKAFAGDPDAMDFAIRSGVVLRGIVRQSEQSLTQGGQDFLEKVFFTQADIKSRVFGALQGRSFAEHMARKLALLNKRFPANVRPAGVQKQMAKIEQKLVGLGLDPGRITARGGYLSEQDMLQAGQTVSGDVNFWGDSLSLPEFFRSSYGKYITQFKSFGFQQSRMIKEHILKPLIKGDWGPVTRFAITMPLGGEIIANLKALARARTGRFEENPEPDAVVLRIAENISNAAGFGIAYDAFEATRYGMSGSLGFFAGPIGGTAAKAMTAAGEFSRGEPEKALRLGIETGLPALTALAAPAALPIAAVVSPALSNILLPKRERP